jgi:hypothetical protein
MRARAGKNRDSREMTLRIGCEQGVQRGDTWKGWRGKGGGKGTGRREEIEGCVGVCV